MEKFSVDDFIKKNIPTESEITSSWSPGAPPLVSIVCITYNQAHYINDALRGFLIQKTDFPFEIIIHDDASTDETREIIKKYAEYYPKIITTILQSENQYRKLKNSVVAIPFSRANGEYIAFCEGDDFWIDNYKLQTQVDSAIKHPAIGLFFHPAIEIRGDGAAREINKLSNEDKIVSLSEVITGGGGFMPSASLLIKKDYVKDLPAWFLKAPVADYYIQIIASSNGAYYTKKTGCIYRYASSTSVSHAHLNSDSSKIVEHFNLEIESLENINHHYNYRYDKEIRLRKAIVAQSCAALLLERSEHKIFKDLIDKSWRYKSFACRQQKILKALKNTPRVALNALKAIRKISGFYQKIQTKKNETAKNLYRDYSNGSS